jgi:glycosyltransferase involved in cell wall biosynthesis
MAWDVPLLGVHHGPADELLTPRGKAAAAALALCCRRTVAVSAELARRLAAVHVRATVIPGTVNTDFWRCGGAGPSRAGTICMVGSLEPSKDHPTLLEAVALLRQRGLNVRLRLVGEGSRRDELQRLTRELGIAEQVAFVGELDASSVREELCSAAAVAHITRSEGLSLSVMEAMAAGKAIVASDVAGVRELIEHERTGLLAACGDAQALAVLLGRVVSDRDLALRLGMAASQAAAGGGVGELSANYVRILTALADGFF